MSKLKAVSPKKVAESKPKILIFGKSGVGKTFNSLDFPAAYFIDTEGGANLDHYTDRLKKSGGMYLGPEQGSLDFDTILEQVQALATEDHKFNTLIIDSITKVYNLAITKEAERLGDKNAFGADKKPAIAYMRRLISWLNRLDMNVILIAHEKAEWGIVNGERTQVGVTFDAYDKLEYELHLALNIQKNGPNRTARIRKSRLQQFPEGESFPWSYEAFAEKYGKEIITKEHVKIALASEAQVAEIQSLLAIVKLPEGMADKWLDAADAADWPEMDAEKIVKCIDALKAKLPKPAETKEPAKETKTKKTA